MMRATASSGPPAGNGTTIVTGRDGYSCPIATPMLTTNAVMAARIACRAEVCRIFPPTAEASPSDGAMDVKQTPWYRTGGARTRAAVVDLPGADRAMPSRTLGGALHSRNTLGKK